MGRVDERVTGPRAREGVMGSSEDAVHGMKGSVVDGRGPR